MYLKIYYTVAPLVPLVFSHHILISSCDLLPNIHMAT